MDDFEGLITYEEVIDSSIHSYYNVEEGTYKILFDKYNLCYLFDNNDNLIYELNDSKSYSILRRIKDLNLNGKTINISEHKYLDYNVKLICMMNINIKEIFIQTPNEELIFIDEINITLNLKPSSEYIITNFEKSKYSGIITTSTGQKYYICRRLLDILQRYFKCKNNKITCVYNNKEEIPKLTLITNQWDEFKNIQGEYIPILRQRLKMEIGEKKFSFYVNNSDFINNKEHLYRFSAVYIHDDNIFAYDITKDKYYYLNGDDIALLMLNNIDKKINHDFNNGMYLDLYTCIIKNNEKQCINIEDNPKEIKYYFVKLEDDSFKTVLDISLLQDNKPKIIYNDDVIIDFD